MKRDGSSRSRSNDAAAGVRASRIDTLHLPGKKEARRVRAREDMDTDYAEEAEDFFYGEGR
jgi:hypothetical protein